MTINKAAIVQSVLDVAGFEFCKGQENFLFYRASRIVPRWWGGGHRGPELITHLYLGPRLRIKGARPLLPHVFIEWTRIYFTVTRKCNCMYNEAFLRYIFPAFTLSVKSGKCAFLACAILACHSSTVSDFACILACFFTGLYLLLNVNSVDLTVNSLCEVPVRINSPYTPFLYEVLCPGL